MDFKVLIADSSYTENTMNFSRISLCKNDHLDEFVLNLIRKQLYLFTCVPRLRGVRVQEQTNYLQNHDFLLEDTITIIDRLKPLRFCKKSLVNFDKKLQPGKVTAKDLFGELIVEQDEQVIIMTVTSEVSLKLEFDINDYLLVPVAKASYVYENKKYIAVSKDFSPVKAFGFEEEEERWLLTVETHERLDHADMLLESIDRLQKRLSGVFEERLQPDLNTKISVLGLPSAITSRLAGLNCVTLGDVKNLPDLLENTDVTALKMLNCLLDVTK